MSLFSDMEKLGLGKVNVDNVFKEEPKPGKKQNVLKEPVKEVITEETVLFDKTYKCPVCDHEFKVKAVRTGKVKLIDQDEDLRPIYDNNIDPLKYDAVTCTRCGYTALTRYYMALTNGQLRTIKQEYCANFRGIPEESPLMSYDGALTRHKLALICAMKRNAKSSELAYIFLKMAWLFHGKAIADNIQEGSKGYNEYKQNALECVAKAYEGFASAFSKETFPMCGMDEVSLRYIMAEFAYKLDKKEESVRWLAGVLTSRTAPQRIKDKALDLKDKIKAEVAEGK